MSATITVMVMTALAKPSINNSKKKMPVRDSIEEIFEKLYPAAGAVLAVSVGWYFGFRIEDSQAGVLNSSLTFGAILTGFLATSQAVILAIRRTAIWRHLDGKKLSDLVIAYLWQAIISSFAFSLWSIIGYFRAFQLKIYSLVWLALGVFAALAFWRFTSLLFFIVRSQRRSHNQANDL